MDIQQQLNRFLSPLKTRVYNMVVRGVVKIVNDATKVQQMQNTLLAGEVKDGLECYQWYGFTSVPLPGMETAVVFCGGDRSNGVIVAVGDRQFRLKGLQGGEVALYTDEGDYLKFARGRNIKINTVKLDIKATDSVNFDTPVINTTGKIDAASDINDHTSTMQAMRDIYNNHDHPGDSGGTTGAPNASM
ncbi:MAG: phage baseplate assembly protein [Alphaproteobacteria bacterium]|nr:phage baseplate assembly protein [Alphaproteobacteria bacterium]